MAAEAEAAREARAKVIAAEGEKKASGALREASEIISESPAALQLRYLQVMTQSQPPPPPLHGRVLTLAIIYIKFSSLSS